MKRKSPKYIWIRHPKGTICYRCGSLKKDSMQCSSWGIHYPRHMWNKEEYKTKAYFFEPTKDRY